MSNDCYCIYGTRTGLSNLAARVGSKCVCICQQTEAVQDTYSEERFKAFSPLCYKSSGQVPDAVLNKQTARYATMAEIQHKSFVTLFRDLQLKRPLITILVDGRCMLWLSAVAR